MEHHSTSRFKAVIFDLDNTLADATLVGDDFFRPAFEAIRRANKGHLTEERLNIAFVECWKTAFDTVAKNHGFTSEMTEAGHAAFGILKVEPHKNNGYVGYSDLHLIQEVPGKLYLVTSGYKVMQDSKVDALGIRKWFSGIVIDVVGEPHPPGEVPGKKAIFEKIQKAGGWKASEVLVVGDNPISEIAAGNALGMLTVQMLRPRVLPSIAADHHILHLEDLWPILGLGQYVPRQAELHSARL